MTAGGGNCHQLHDHLQSPLAVEIATGRLPGGGPCGDFGGRSAAGRPCVRAASGRRGPLFGSSRFGWRGHVKPKGHRFVGTGDLSSGRGESYPNRRPRSTIAPRRPGLITNAFLTIGRTAKPPAILQHAILPGRHHARVAPGGHDPQSRATAPRSSSFCRDTFPAPKSTTRWPTMPTRSITTMPAGGASSSITTGCAARSTSCWPSCPRPRWARRSRCGKPTSSGRAVIAISPMKHNWAVKFLSHELYADVDELRAALESGRLAERLGEILGR